MCLTTRHPAIKVAESDIKVYKSWSYPYRNLLQRIFTKVKEGYSIIMSHTYLRNEVQPNEELVPYELGGGKWSVESGYHSDKDKRGDSNALFIIPRGTKYIEGWYGDRVSRKNYVS